LLARLVTARPWITLLALLVVTVALGYGAVHRAPPPETRATLPQGSAVAEALHDIEDLFTETGEASVVTLLFRGDALTPGGLAQMDSLVAEIVADPSVAELLAPGDAVIAPSHLVMALLQVPNFDSVSQADIDNLQKIRSGASTLFDWTQASTIYERAIPNTTILIVALERWLAEECANHYPDETATVTERRAATIEVHAVLTEECQRLAPSAELCL